MKAFCHYIFVAMTCFSLLCSGSAVYHSHHTSHNTAEITGTSHAIHAHVALSNIHLASAHKSHHIDSSKQCCQTSPRIPSESKRISVLPNKTKTFRSSLVAAFSSQIATNRFQHSGKWFNSRISNTINPTLESLRTVILLT